MSRERPNVVIVGAGFGGIEAAKSLSRAAVDVTLIDRQNYHCFQPLLYQVATAALSPADIAWPIRHILRRQQNATVFMAEVTGVDLTAQRVQIAGDPIPYDYLVLATGATHSYFGHDEWADCAPGLKRIEDATRIRRSLLIAFEQAELTGDEAERQRLLTFVIVGAGATGVEMAGAIAEIALQTLPKDFRRIDPRKSKIVLLEAGPRVLPTFPQELSDYANRAMVRMGVDVRTSTRVESCDRRGVNLDRGRLDAGTIIWAAGVIASPAAQWLAAEHDRAGRVIVGPDLSLPGRPNVFVIGDTASVRDEKGNNVPGVAPAAKQMGRYVGKLIAARVAGNALPAFRYRHPGDLATIGRRAAVVKLNRVHLKGFIGWLFWSVAHIYFLIGLRHRFIVAFTWLWDYLTLQRSARLITEVRPQDRREEPACSLDATPSKDITTR
jgi:NADH:quinone reductase (non-electrogenic)